MGILNLGSGIVSIIILICAIWVIYDVWTNNRGLSDVSKIVWTILAIVFSIITAIVYYFIGKK